MEKMRSPYLAIGLAALLFWPFSGGVQAEPGFRGMTHNYVYVEPPQTAPDGPFLDILGVQHRLSQHRGKVLLVNFWATWCPACIIEMPHLNRLQEILGGDRFQVMTISQDTGGTQVVENFLKKRNLKSLPLYFDPKSELGKAFGQSLLPTSFLIDAKGREVGSLIGAAYWDSPEALTLIKGYMTEAGKPFPSNPTPQAGN
ncbi:MAG TPA: TlpA family protein disulfide reductase [Rhodospirillales bacterium]|nr:TlpA family protein disulfide reductase [Rhodospirillales bacterium]